MKKVENYKLKVRTFLKKLFTRNFSPVNNLKGFTLIEIVMIIVIASIAIPTLLLLLGQQAKYGVDAELRVSETNLAQQLMEEIKSKKWDQNSPIPPGAYSDLGIDGAETYSTYNDVDDYRAGVPAVTVGGVSYTRTVQVCYVPSTNLDSMPCVTAGASATNYKRISVTINNPTNSQSVEVVTVVTNY